MCIQDVTNLLIFEVSVEAIDYNFWIGWIDKHERLFETGLDNVGVIILEQWDCKDPERFFDHIIIILKKRLKMK